MYIFAEILLIMFNNIKQHTELGLAERSQLSATEIYSSQGIPTGDTMPDYTRTHTSEGSISFSSPVMSKVEQLREILLSSDQNPSEGELCLFFKLMQKQYAPQINSVFKDLRRWSIRVRARKRCYPIREDLIAKQNEFYKLLYAKDSDFPFETYFSNGVDDTADAGAYLLSLPEMNREEEELNAIRLLSAVQWLIRERDKLPVESAPVVLEADDVVEEEKIDSRREADIENEELLNLYNVLHLGEGNGLITLGEKSYNRGKILTAVMHMYKEENKSWAENPSRFSNKLVDILPATQNLTVEEKNKKVKAFAKCLNREIPSIKGLHLKDLSVENICIKTDCLKKIAEEVFDQWDSLYPYVLECRDNIRGQKENKEETERGH